MRSGSPRSVRHGRRMRLQRCMARRRGRIGRRHTCSASRSRGRRGGSRCGPRMHARACARPSSSGGCSGAS
eukprot:5909186-Prymnesium_polylepis.1